VQRRSERLDFAAADGTRLAARLERPVGEPTAYALFAHCFTCSKDVKAAARIGRALAERGIAVLLFDFTGLGESAGDFADTDFSSNLDDLVAAADFLRDHHAAPRLLIGHSLGGAAVIAAAHRIPESVAIATLGAPSDTEHVRDTLLRRAPELARADRAEVDLGGRTFTVRRELLDDLAENHVQDRLARLDRALLILHSPTDAIVDVDHARRIFERARHPKSFVALDGADHLLTDARDAGFVGELLASWAGRYVARQAEAPTTDDSSAPGEVIVSSVGSGFRTEIVAGRHRLVADEPVEVGGDDAGPGPYDLLLAALGACTSMTLRMYADRKQWPLESVAVQLRHARVHARDCEDCESENGFIDRIERVLSLGGPLDETQRARLLEIASKCPVHRSLLSETVIPTRLAD